MVILQAPFQFILVDGNSKFRNAVNGKMCVPYIMEEIFI